MALWVCLSFLLNIPACSLTLCVFVAFWLVEVSALVVSHLVLTLGYCFSGLECVWWVSLPVCWVVLSLSVSSPLRAGVLLSVLACRS